MSTGGRITIAISVCWKVCPGNLSGMTGGSAARIPAAYHDSPTLNRHPPGCRSGRHRKRSEPIPTAHPR